MKIIEDLGYTDLGYLKVKRHFIKIECPNCSNDTIIRKERINIVKCCKACKGNKQVKNKMQQADIILENGNQTCTKCKAIKPLISFHKDSSKLSGHRKVCKECRYELEKENNKRYLQSEAGKISSASRKGKRRSKINSSDDGTINSESLTALKDKQENKCYYCKSDLDFTIPRSVHLDHVIPLSKNGKHTLDNVVWSCQTCNLTKSDKLL